MGNLQDRQKMLAAVKLRLHVEITFYFDPLFKMFLTAADLRSVFI